MEACCYSGTTFGCTPVYKLSTMVDGASSHPSFWASLLQRSAGEVPIINRVLQQCVLASSVWSPQKVHSMYALTHRQQGRSLGSRWEPVYFLRVVRWLFICYANLILPHSGAVLSRGVCLAGACGEGVFFDRNKPL